jgi:flagellar motility protein MotE (MotC chaperone)
MAALWDVLRSNTPQLILAATTIVAAMVAARATNGGNRVRKMELDHTKRKAERETAMQEQAKSREIELNESQLTIKRQEALYEKTYQLISTLENRLENQEKEQHKEREEFRQEREGLRDEIRGFRAQVRQLERRVFQLVRAFRDATGKEPPEPEGDSEN